MEKSYYLIRQEIPFLVPKFIRIYEKANIKHVKEFIDTLIGNIYVYHYDTKNERKDLTNELGFTNFELNSVPFEKIRVYVHTYTLLGSPQIRFEIYGIDELTKKFPRQFFMRGSVCFYLNTEYRGVGANRSLFFLDVDNKKDNDRRGKVYEKFVAKKYQEKDFMVTLHGIEKGYSDGGIDIVAENDEKIVLIQCKNWAQSNVYKINHKDLRAFIGDCYLYILDNHISDKKIAFHFIVSHEKMLTKSARHFLNKRNFLKYKCIPFEQRENI